MGDYASIRDGIKSAVTAVVGANVPVYGYQRFVADLPTYIGLFKTTDSAAILHGWIVTPASQRPMGAPLGSTFAGGAMGDIARDYLFVVRGYYGLQDSTDTEGTFMGIAESVVQALDAKKNYGDSSVVSYDTEASLDVFDLRQFGSVLCHRAEIRVKATVQRPVTYA